MIGVIQTISSVSIQNDLCRMTAKVRNVANGKLESFVGYIADEKLIEAYKNKCQNAELAIVDRISEYKFEELR